MDVLLSRLGFFFYNLFHFRALNDTPSFVTAIVLCGILFAGVMTLLHFLPSQGKKWVMIVATFVAGLFFSLEYFLPVHDIGKGQLGNFLTPHVEPVSDYIQYILIWTFVLGIISLSIVHGRRIVLRQAGWHNSLVFFIAMISIMVVGFMSRTGGYGKEALQEFGSLVSASGAKLQAGVIYDTLFSGLLINLDAAMFSLLAFYIASAAYRAFRVRTVEAALLMVAALVIMLGFVNFGVLLTSWIPLDSPFAFFRTERLAGFILNVFNMPGQRAVQIGVQIGALAMAMRLWLSLERGTFFSMEK
ncbi:MAG: hypothetical protein ACYDBB_24040 [Armatimonadota bacterium]